MHSEYSYNQKYFTDGMSGWHSLSFDSIAGKFRTFAKGARIERLLDFGCGDGFYAPLLRECSREVDGADLDPSSVMPEKRSCYGQVLAGNLGERWMAPTAPYDALFSSEVIEHVEDYAQFLRNAFGALKPGGRLFLTTTTYAFSLPIFLTACPGRVTPKALLEFVRGLAGDLDARARFVRRIWGWTKGHFHGFGKRQLRAALHDTGFEVQSIEYLHVQPVIDPVFFRNPFRNAPLRPLVLCTAAVCRPLVSSVNYLCRTLDLYGANVIVIASKPAST